MKNESLSLNFHLPEIKHNNNRFSKSVKESNKEQLVIKLKDKNIVKFQTNSIKNWSRNISKMNFDKRKKSSLNEDNNIKNDKVSSIIYNKNKNKLGYNLTLSCTLKEKREQDSNKTNILLNNKIIKYTNYKSGNDILINGNNKNKTSYDPSGENNLYENKYNNKKYINNRYDNYYSDYYTPNKIKQKNKFDLSTINVAKINDIFKKLSKKENTIDSKTKNKNNSKANLSNNNSNNNSDNKNLINNEDSTQNSIFLNNNIKELDLEKAHRKNKRKYHISQNKKKSSKNIININNIKYKLMVPGLMNASTSNFKENILKSLEEQKSNNISEPLLKNLKYHETINNVNNFILILKQHINIEAEFNNIFDKNKSSNNNNNMKNNLNMVKCLINKYNLFFNSLNDISFEINIFVQKEYNNLIQKIIKILICFHCLIFIILTLYDINTCLNIIQIQYLDIFKKISFCLYNFFLKFIIVDLRNNKYNDLSFINSLNNLYANNPNYVIKSTLSNNDIFSLIHKNNEILIDIFKKKLYTNNSNFMSEILLSLKTVISNIQNKDLLYIIDTCLNIFLYTILNKNFQKALSNSICPKTKNSLNSVPYLPPISDSSNYKYTVVLDMDETLGHFISNEIKIKYFSNYGYLILDDKNNFNKNSENKDKIKVGLFLIRPYAKYFLEELNNLLYEIVVFTASTKEYCDKILDILDINNNLIKYRLYRSHVSLRNINNDVKDLSLLGRDLNKIIIIDNYPDNYKLQRDNGLPINSWTGDINDTSLKDLLNIMKYFVENNVKDVRDIIRKIKVQLNNNNINYSKIDLR